MRQPRPLIALMQMLSAVLALGAGAVALAASGPRAGAGGIVVDPLEVRAQLAPGSATTHPIRLINNLKQPITVTVTPAAAVQQGNGVAEFLDADEYPASCGGWLAVANVPAALAPGEGTTLQVTVRAPKEAVGDRLCAVLIELRPAEEGPSGRTGAGLTRAVTRLVLRYAVLVRVTLEGTRAPVKVGVRRMDWERQAKPALRVDVANLAQATTAVQAEAVVLTEDGARILERLRLEGRQADRPAVLLNVAPGGYVTFTGRLTKSLAAGAYQARVIVRYDQTRTLVASAPLTLDADAVAEPDGGAPRAGVRLESEPLDLALAPNGRRTVVIPVWNETSAPVTVALAARPSQTLCTGWTIEVPETVTVAAMMRYGAPLTLIAGPGVQTQCQAELTGRILEGAAAGAPALAAVPVRARLTTMAPQARVSGVTLRERRMTVTVENTGPVALEPTVQVLLDVPGAAEPARVALAAEGPASLAPGDTRVFAGAIPAGLRPGRYAATATLDNAGKQPLSVTGPASVLVVSGEAGRGAASRP